MDVEAYTPVFDLPLAAILVIVASIAGGLLPAIARLTHRQMQLLLSLVAGLMLGVAAFDLLPEAIERQAHLATELQQHIQFAAMWAVGGFLLMFLLERFLCYHHHDTDDADHDCGHGHAVTWKGAIVGLTIHSFIGGVAMAAAIHAGVESREALPGFAAVIAIAVHKPFDALTLGTLMAAAKEPVARRHRVNILFSLATPLGMLAASWVFFKMDDPTWIAAALALSAGTFFCIALSDLLPELHFHQHDRVGLTVALLMGLTIAWGVASVHTHAHDETTPASLGVQDTTTDGSDDHDH
jgi:zinc and cadmium transporter